MTTNWKTSRKRYHVTILEVGSGKPVRGAETKTAAGLYIPDTAKEKPQQGTILAAGPGKKDEPMELKVGDVVLYGKYAGTEITVEGKNYLIMKQSDVLAVL